MTDSKSGGGPRRVKSPRKIKLPLPGPATGSSLVPVTPVSKHVPDSDPLLELDRRIATAPVSELPTLVRVRGAMIEQDEFREGGRHARAGQRGAFYAKVGFSVAAGVGGAVLIGTGFWLPGFFLLGGSAAVYVPDYVKDALNKLRSGFSDAE